MFVSWGLAFNMMVRYILINVITVLLFFQCVYGQSEVIDSLNTELNKKMHDTLRFQAIKLKVFEFRKLGQFDSAIQLNTNLYAIANRIDDLSLLSEAYKTEFRTLYLNKSYKEAKELYHKFIKLLILNKDTVNLADAYFELGANEHGAGNAVGSIEYFFNSAIYAKALGNPIKAYRALAITYGSIDDLEKAYEYNQKVIDLAIEKKDYASLARGYLSKGYQLKEMGENAESFKASKKAVEVYLKELNSPKESRLSLIYGNISEVYLYYHENNIDSVFYLDSNFKYAKDLSSDVLDSAKLYIDKSLEISELGSFDHHVYNAKTRSADYYYYLEKYNKALKIYLECYELCKGESNMLSNEILVTAKLYQTYKTIKKFDKSLEFYEYNLTLQDSLYNKDKQRDLGKQEAKFEFEKQKVIDEVERGKLKVIEEALIKKEKAIAIEQKKKQNIITYSIALGVIVISIFSFLIFKRLRIARAQQLLIESQKVTLEKNRNKILESIEYSKNIQKRIFIPVKEVKRLLPNSFLFFKPKDVVSGDFYWVHRKGNKTYFSVADCTGHGVPGAFMTLISLNLINSIILEDDVNSTAAILERLHVRLKERLSSSEEEQMKHGLDIAMCAYNHDTNELEYSGLHNPIYIINKDNELREIKGDNLFLGISSNFNVKNHIIDLKPGDSVYMSTDGFPDQKGGGKGKKYYSSRLRNTLREVDLEPLEERKQLLDKKLQDWKGEKEQIDDICIMGVSF
jgi:serine phosphatase RsbU (regulator of sigma subunit)